MPLYLSKATAVVLTSINLPDSENARLHSLIEKTFSYYHKTLEPETMRGSGGDEFRTGKMISGKEKVALYHYKEKPLSKEWTLTRGFFRRMIKLLGDNNFRFRLVIEPKVKVEKVLVDNFSFRFSQKEIYEKIMRGNEGGMVVLPTRYGKTYIMTAVILSYKCPVALLVPGKDLMEQQFNDLCKWIPKDQIGRYDGSRKKIGERVTIISLDSLKNMPDAALDQFKLVICDEVHSSVSPERAPTLSRFAHARMLGFTATDSGRYDNGDILMEGMFGPTIVRRTYAEAVKEGAICQIKVFVVKVPLKFKRAAYTRNKAYQYYHYFNDDLIAKVYKIMEEIIPKDWQTLAFIDTIDQSEYLKSKFPSSYQVAVASLLPKKKDREEVNRKMAAGEIKRCFATGIYSQGVTFSDLRCMVNLAGGGGSITSVQRPGRLAETREGKTYGYMFDFQFEADFDPWTIKQVPEKSREWTALVRDSKNRIKVYERLGYEIEIVDDLSKIKLT